MKHSVNRKSVMWSLLPAAINCFVCYCPLLQGPHSWSSMKPIFLDLLSPSRLCSNAACSLQSFKFHQTIWNIPLVQNLSADFMFSQGNSIYRNPAAFIYFIPIYCSEVSLVILKYMTFLIITETNEINKSPDLENCFGLKVKDITTILMK